jgi:hypothetical protein
MQFIIQIKLGTLRIEFIDPYGHHPFSIDGSCKYRVVVTLHHLLDQPLEQLCTYHSTDTKLDYLKIQPKFGWIPIDIIDQTFRNTA